MNKKLKKKKRRKFTRLDDSGGRDRDEMKSMKQNQQLNIAQQQQKERTNKFAGTID